MDLNNSSSLELLEKKFDFFKTPVIAKSPIPYLAIKSSGVLLFLMVLFDKMGSSYYPIASALNIVSLLCGIGFCIKSALLLKKWNESEGHAPLLAAIILIMLALLLCFVETFISDSHTIMYAGNINL
jgi:hypothetical protein